MLNNIQDPSELKPQEASELRSWTSGFSPKEEKSSEGEDTDMYGPGWIVF